MFYISKNLKNQIKFWVNGGKKINLKTSIFEFKPCVFLSSSDPVELDPERGVNRACTP